MILELIYPNHIILIASDFVLSFTCIEPVF